MQFESWFQSLQGTPALQGQKISLASADAVLRLSAEGGTVPFIARYRKEQTGNLDEVGIQAVIEAKEKWDQILKRQAHILEEIEKQKKLTPELKAQIETTFDANQLEDIYLPYKQKRKTKAALAKEAGLEPLADWIWNCGHGTEQPQPGQTLEIWAFTFRNDAKDIKDAQSAIDGAQDILIERLAEIQELRQLVRTQYFEHGNVKTGKTEKAKPNSKYENYFEHHEPVSALLKPQNSHRYLAMRRGWMEEELSLNLGGKPDDASFDQGLLARFESEACTVQDSPGAAILLKAARLAFKGHVVPSIESEVHKSLKEVADLAATAVFAENVRKLLMAAPFGPKAVLGVDPGIRTGCKLAVVDDTGKYIASAVIHLQSETEKSNAKVLLTEVVKTGSIRAIAVGNGTAGRETEVFLRQAMKEGGLEVPVVMVSESGASVYSASEVAREEFPDLDLTIRGAISIARRLQDPLAELVKVDPKSIGVGQYQHDISEHALKRSLEHVVDSCVNQVGVNLNTASYHLLSHVSGIGPALAKAIVVHRGEKGLFKSRDALLDVPRFSKKAFEQAAGFLRIPDSAQPLDNTGIHPERYSLLEKVASRIGKGVSDLMGKGVDVLKKDQEFWSEAGEFTAKDILQELAKPGRDPREQFVPFQFREDIHELKDLKPEMVCPGIVTNVTNFGAFVDIGVHQDGLVHISQLSHNFVKDPRDVVSPGDRVQVKVMEVNLEKSQISLSMKLGEAAPRAEKPQRHHHQERERRPERPKPQQPRTDGPKVTIQPKSASRPASSGASGKPPKTIPQKQIFNNAFAGLAALKKQLGK